MRRLALPLALAVLALASGCLLVGFGAADHTQYTLAADRVPRDRIAENATVDLAPRERAVVAAALRNGSAETVADLDLAREARGVQRAYVERNGTYYRVRVDGGETTAPRYVLRVDAANRTPGNATSLDALPEADADAFRRAWKALAAGRRDDGDGPPPEAVYRTPPDESAFVPEPSVRFVAYRNETFRVSATRRNVSLHTDVYRLERVAATESAFVDRLVTDVSGLEGDAREVVSTAVSEGRYRVRRHRAADIPEAFDRAVAACGFPEKHEVVRSSAAPVRYVRFEGAYYRLTLTGHTTAA
ncbi:MAG: hypothetical protein ABEJ04_01970 [Halobacteriaceae archaeon]